MDRYPKRIFVRVSEEEHDQAMQLASSLGLTCSELVRVLIKMPKDFIGDKAGNTIVVIDRDSVRQLTRETRHWGHQFNQIAKALNTIALRLQHASYGNAEAMQDLRKVAEKLDSVDNNMVQLCKDSERICESWLAAI